MKLHFYGGVGVVTGANYLLESAGEKILVDCGLQQGSHYAERKNFEPFPYDPKEIKAVFITHSHLDHIGRLPKLLKDGFRGEIYSTFPARDFAEVMLLDSEHILSKEAEREKKPPLYSESDVYEVMKSWRGVDYHQPIKFGGFEVKFFDAGHILGSAIIKIKAEGKTIVFSGDLGNTPPPIVRSTEKIESADYCVMESTYGDRLHERARDRQEMLEDAIEDTVKAGGTLLIPAFAMERTQELLYHMDELFTEGRVPRVPVFLDSPLAIKLTAVYKKYGKYFNLEASAIVRSGDFLNFPGLRLSPTTEESKKINDVPPPKIIIAGSGMSHGGRILHHEIRYLPDPKSMILFIGYQAKGSMGRTILDGTESVKIFGEAVPVRCAKKTIGGYSAHADQAQLIDWVRSMKTTLSKVFIVQGEQEVSEILAQKIRDELALDAIVPEINQELDL